MTQTRRIWIRAFYDFAPDETGYIGWTREAARDRMIPLLQPGDLFMIYGAGSAETPKASRSLILGFLEVEPRPIRDYEKASEKSMQSKRERGKHDKWTYGLPILRAWRAEEELPIKSIATTTYRTKARQGIAVWGKLLTPQEAEQALKIKVTEVNVFGEVPIPDTGLREEPISAAFRPSRAFPGSFGERISLYEDGETWLYLTQFEGDGHALLGIPRTASDKSVLVKVGVSGDPIGRLAQINAGFPPAAIGKWGKPLTSGPYSNRESAETAEQKFKDLAQGRLESLGGEFFRGDWTAAEILFATISGIPPFGK